MIVYILDKGVNFGLVFTADLKSSEDITEPTIVAYTHDADQKVLTHRKYFDLKDIVGFIWSARFPTIATYNFR